MPDEHPVIADRYELEERLGRGGMSEVWGATDRELGRRVALKLLAPDADTARFDREARAIASLAHPNIVQLFDYGHDEGRPYMVLEYVPGGTLEDRLAAARGQPLPDGEAAAVAGGIAAGLAHAHARGVVHRDLKPANVLFDGEGRAKIADFGIARLAAGEGTLTEAGTVLGTAAYISPEQATGAPASPASDVYSFGVLLYRMLTGRLPFESDDPLELVRLNRDELPPPIAALRPDPPGRLEAAATAALEKDPADRPRDGAALLAALGIAAGTALATATTALAADATQVLPAAAGAPTTAVPVAAGPPPEPPRSRLPLAVAVLLVLLLAGGALAYAVTRPPASNGDSATTTPSLPSTTLPTRSTTSTSTPATTAAPTTSTTAPTATTTSTTAPTTTRHHPTTQQTTVAPPPPTTTLTTPTIPTTPTTTPATTATTPVTTSATTTLGLSAQPTTTGP